MKKDLAEKEKKARYILSEISKYNIKNMAALSGSERRSFRTLLFEYNQLGADPEFRPILEKLETKFVLPMDLKKVVGKGSRSKTDKSERNWMYYQRDEEHDKVIEAVEKEIVQTKIIAEKNPRLIIEQSEEAKKATSVKKRKPSEIANEKAKTEVMRANKQSSLDKSLSTIDKTTLEVKKAVSPKSPTKTEAAMKKLKDASLFKKAQMFSQSLDKPAPGGNKGKTGKIITPIQPAKTTEKTTDLTPSKENSSTLEEIKKRVQTLYNKGKNVVEKQYKNAETVGDYAKATGAVVGKGVLKVGDAVWGGVSTVADVSASGVNWALEKIGCDSRIVNEELTYQAYKRDPLKFLKNMVVPTTEDIKTGLRSDDNLMTLIDQDNPKALEAYIQKGKEDINRNIKGAYDGGDTPYNTALQYAVAKGNMKVASVLYQQSGVNYNGYNAMTGDTLLMTLLYETSPDASEPEYKTGKSNIAALPPAQQEKMRFRQCMIDDLIRNKSGINIHKTNKAGKDAFMVAAESGNLSAVVALLEKGANINKTCVSGRNALHYCTHNQLMTEYLIKLGVNCNQVDKNGETPLMFALRNGDRNLNCISMLLMASDEKGVAKLKESKYCLKRLDALLADKEQAKKMVMMVEGHPMAALFKERYPKEAEKLAQQIAEEQKKQETASTSEALANETSTNEVAAQSQKPVTEANTSNGEISPKKDEQTLVVQETSPKTESAKTAEVDKTDSATQSTSSQPENKGVLAALEQVSDALETPKDQSVSEEKPLSSAIAQNATTVSSKEKNDTDKTLAVVANNHLTER